MKEGEFEDEISSCHHTGVRKEHPGLHLWPEYQKSINGGHHEDVAISTYLVVL